MKKIFLLIIVALSLAGISAVKTPWSESFQKVLLQKVGSQLSNLASHPSIEYPNRNYQEIVKNFPDGKVLIFGYGSLINSDSASNTVGDKALESARPVVAFGLKRLFNYKATNVSHWGTDLHENEKAMLNVVPTTTFKQVINGVVMEINVEDLAKLVAREKGYDLVPILVADWNEVLKENPNVEVQIAYTFLVPDELREGVDYTQTKYYPVRGYLKASRRGASLYGPEFLSFWNETTYLGDGTTEVNQWNETTFSGILDTREP